LAHLRESVVDTGRHGWRHCALNEAIAFEIAEGECEHALGDAGEVAAEFGKAAAAFLELHHDHHCPFVADQLERFRCRAAALGHMKGTTAHQCASLQMQRLSSI